jgi:DNA-binding MarR family transcriptional regulator
MEYEDPVQLADLLQRLTRRLRRAHADRLVPFGLTPAQERALRIITRSEEPPRMTDLADHLGIVPRSVTTVIDALEEAGLVRREIDPHNRREARARAAEDLFAPLSAADRVALGELLTQLDSKSEK